MGNERLIRSLFVVLKILEKQHKITEENLKVYLQEIRNNLADERNIFLDFDFNSTSLCSKVLDEVIEYAIESKLIEAHPGSIHYTITNRGAFFIQRIPNLFDQCLQDEFKTNVSQTVNQIVPQL